MRLLHVCLVALLGASLAPAETYQLTLAQPSEVLGHPLAAGDYRVEVEAGTARFHKGKQMVEVPVRLEQNTAASRSTLVRYDQTGGMYRIREIMPKGTQTRLCFGQ